MKYSRIDGAKCPHVLGYQPTMGKELSELEERNCLYNPVYNFHTGSVCLLMIWTGSAAVQYFFLNIFPASIALSRKKASEVL